MVHSIQGWFSYAVMNGMSSAKRYVFSFFLFVGLCSAIEEFQVKITLPVYANLHSFMCCIILRVFHLLLQSCKHVYLFSTVYTGAGVQGGGERGGGAAGRRVVHRQLRVEGRRGLINSRSHTPCTGITSQCAKVSRLMISTVRYLLSPIPDA